ncbi:MAG: peroxidase family protein, partial [Beijerinckiaceae bacterium]
GVPAGQLFDEARKLTTWHYQWIVLHEFLEKLTGEAGIAARIMKQGRKFYRFKKWPFMPIEFSVAAYRLGHSMVREVYSHNFIFRPNGGIPARFNLLFDFTAKSGRIVGSLLPPGNPLPQPVLPSNWVIDWRRFFDFKTPGTTPNFEFNHSMRLDPLLTGALHALPGEDPAKSESKLPFRNLRRGVMMKLPSAQTIIKHMQKTVKIKALTEQQLSAGPDGAKAASLGFHKQTPLWYYILKEAEQLGGGKHLGPLGATIIAEVFVGLVQGSRASYLAATPAFKPTLGAKPGDFTMVDMLTFSDTVNPLGR